MKMFCRLFFFWMLGCTAYGQSSEIEKVPKKGSYLYYGQPAFEDNSFLLEEAINQEKGAMQYISNFYLDKVSGGNFLYSFTQEIPITNLRHQVSYTLLYHVLSSPATGEKSNGLGDISLGYSYMVSGKNDWAMVVPNFTLIIPTGKAIYGQGSGGLGAQLNLAITKRLSHKIVTHYNIGYTFISQADAYSSALSGKILSFEKDLQYENLGASIVWYQTRKFNWLLEYSTYFLSNIKDDGSISHSRQSIINPGFRFAIDHNRLQIVPGFSVPTTFTDGKLNRTGIYFYLSLEGEYLPFFKPKTR